MVRLSRQRDTLVLMLPINPTRDIVTFFVSLAFIGTLVVEMLLQ